VSEGGRKGEEIRWEWKKGGGRGGEAGSRYEGWVRGGERLEWSIEGGGEGGKQGEARKRVGWEGGGGKGRGSRYRGKRRQIDLGVEGVGD